MSKVFSARLDDEDASWLEEYAGERGVKVGRLMAAAVKGFRQDCESGTPDLPEPEAPLPAGKCSTVLVRGPGVRKECPSYGKPVEPPGDSKFVCPRGDCGWEGSSKIELCPQHNRWAVPRGSASRRIIRAMAVQPATSREDFARRTEMRGEAFSKAKMPLSVIGGSEVREQTNRSRQTVLNKAKGMD